MKPDAPLAIIGTGYLGMAVASAWRGPVLAASRSGSWREGTAPAYVRMLALDVTSPDLDASPLAEAEVAVFCVAPGRVQDRTALYVDGTRRLLERWPRGNLRRVIWVGSTSALPDRDAWLDERCSEWPTSERGQVQRKAEHVVMDFGGTRSVPWLVLRLGGLYGPGRELDRLYRRRREGPLPGNGMAPTNLIHRDDATQAVLAAARASAEIEGIVHGVDDEHPPRRHMYAQLAERTGQPPVTWAEPVPSAAVPCGKRVSNRRLKEWLGVRLQFPTHRLDESP